jgi:glyoxylase I family protein
MKGSNDKIGGGGFHHVAFKAKDFDKSLAFYTEALGFRPTMRWGEGDKRAVMLDTGDGSCIELFAGGSRDPLPDGVLMHIAFNSDNCDKAIEAARKAGAAITMEPKDIDIQSDPVAQVRIGFCKGPDGEILEFFQKR